MAKGTKNGQKWNHADMGSPDFSLLSVSLELITGSDLVILPKGKGTMLKTYLGHHSSHLREEVTSRPFASHGSICISSSLFYRIG